MSSSFKLAASEAENVAIGKFSVPKDLSITALWTENQLVRQEMRSLHEDAVTRSKILEDSFMVQNSTPGGNSKWHATDERDRIVDKRLSEQSSVLQEVGVRLQQVIEQLNRLPSCSALEDMEMRLIKSDQQYHSQLLQSLNAIQLPQASEPILQTQHLAEKITALQTDMLNQFDSTFGRLVKEMPVLLWQDSVEKAPSFSVLETSESKPSELPRRATVLSSEGQNLVSQTTSVTQGTSGTFDSAAVSKIMIDIETERQSMYGQVHARLGEYRRRQTSRLQIHAALSSVVCSWQFSYASFFVIVANAAWMGYEVDHEMKGAATDNYQKPSWHTSFGLVFTTFFLVEVLLRALAEAKAFFVGLEWRWNLFDVLLMLSSIPEYFDVEGSENVLFLRVLRVTKLTKAFRLVRAVRFLGSLREILVSFVKTLGCLFWSLVTMLVVIYMFALFFMQALSGLIARGEHPSSEIMSCFQDIWSSLVSLFSAISGGQDWYLMMDGFGSGTNSAKAVQVAFVLYIFTMTFGILNIILGVFCAKAHEATNTDDELVQAREEEKYWSVLRGTTELFRDIDTAEKGYIIRSELEDYLGCHEKGALRGLPGLSGFPSYEINKLWEFMLTYSESGKSGCVDLLGFVLATLRLSTESKAESVMVSLEILHQTRRMEDTLRKLRIPCNNSTSHDSDVGKSTL